MRGEEKRISPFFSNRSGLNSSANIERQQAGSALYHGPIRPKIKVFVSKNQAKKLGRVGRNFFLLIFYLPGKAVGGIWVINIYLLVVE